MTDISVVPKAVQLNLTIKNVTINVVTVTPYTSATIHATIYYDVQEQSIVSPSESYKYVTIPMPTVDYLMWQNDDSYLINFVLSKLNLVKA